ncbi:VOC family protein [Nocardioides sp.]|uniref:VOC family protein n=1 Tax=Nocardioides sp. TaxID=35761 RepID=UPI00261E5FB7|nr:VOC family protein [Nocardioides sp.]
MTDITTCLWLSHPADEVEKALAFYADLIPGSSVTSSQRVGPPGGETVLAEVTLAGTPYRVIGAPVEFSLNPSVSLSVSCADQAEVDRYWDALTADGGQESQCGWLVDPWGLSWQIVPTRLGELLGDPDPERSGRASAAMMQMRRIVVADLEAAADGRS